METGRDARDEVGKRFRKIFVESRIILKTVPTQWPDKNTSCAHLQSVPQCVCASNCQHSARALFFCVYV